MNLELIIIFILFVLFFSKKIKKLKNELIKFLIYFDHVYCAILCVIYFMLLILITYYLKDRKLLILFMYIHLYFLNKITIYIIILFIKIKTKIKTNKISIFLLILILIKLNSISIFLCIYFIIFNLDFLVCLSYSNKEYDLAFMGLTEELYEINLTKKGKNKLNEYFNLLIFNNTFFYNELRSNYNYNTDIDYNYKNYRDIFN